MYLLVFEILKSVKNWISYYTGQVKSIDCSVYLSLEMFTYSDKEAMHPLYVGLVLVIITYITHTSYAFTGLLTYPYLVNIHWCVYWISLLLLF